MTAKKKAPVKVAKPAESSAAAKAYEATLHEAAALGEGDLQPINVDVAQAVAIALGAKPGLLKERAAIVAALPNHPIAKLDHLERYALAAWYAHVLYKSAADAAKALSAAEDQEATTLRATLLKDADALAHRGLLDQGSVDAIRQGPGTGVDRANDLVALAALFSAHWSEVHTKTAATADEVARAGVLGTKLLVALGVANHTPKLEPTVVADQRARTFTLFYRAYDQCRRAMSYLRWDEDDVDEVCPSLLQGHGRHATASAPVEAPAPAQSTAPPAAPHVN